MMAPRCQEGVMALLVSPSTRAPLGMGQILVPESWVEARLPGGDAVAGQLERPLPGDAARDPES